MTKTIIFGFLLTQLSLANELFSMGGNSGQHQSTSPMISSKLPPGSPIITAKIVETGGKVNEINNLSFGGTTLEIIASEADSSANTSVNLTNIKCITIKQNLTKNNIYSSLDRPTATGVVLADIKFAQDQQEVTFHLPANLLIFAKGKHKEDKHWSIQDIKSIEITNVSKRKDVAYTSKKTQNIEPISVEENNQKPEKSTTRFPLWQSIFG